MEASGLVREVRHVRADRARFRRRVDRLARRPGICPRSIHALGPRNPCHPGRRPDRRRLRQAARATCRRRPGGAAPPDGGLPPLEGTGPAARSIRLWTFLADEVHRLEEGGQLSLSASHACLAEANERIKFFRKRLGPPPLSKPSDREPEVPTVLPVEPRRPILEILLDPRSIQWFLAFGGGLFVLGLVLFLYAKGVFQNPLIVAVCIGTANLAGLLGGWALLTKTRYQLAGRADAARLPGHAAEPVVLPRPGPGHAAGPSLGRRRGRLRPVCGLGLGAQGLDVRPRLDGRRDHDRAAAPGRSPDRPVLGNRGTELAAGCAGPDRHPCRAGLPGR